MNSFQALIFNVFILIVFGSWLALGAYDKAATAMQLDVLIPPISGLFLLLLSPWIAKQKNRSLLLAAIVTIGLLFYFYKPFIYSTGEPKIRVIIQIVTCIWSLFFLVKNLITNKLKKTASTETKLPL